MSQTQKLFPGLFRGLGLQFLCSFFSCLSLDQVLAGRIQKKTIETSFPVLESFVKDDFGIKDGRVLIWGPDVGRGSERDRGTPR